MIKDGLSFDTVKPITPKEVHAAHYVTRKIPDVVITTVNQLLLEKANRSASITLNQNEILERLDKAGLSRSEVFGRGWLDFEPVYSDAWDVKYGSPAPGYNEEREAVFIFTPKT